MVLRSLVSSATVRQRFFIAKLSQAKAQLQLSWLALASLNFTYPYFPGGVDFPPSQGGGYLIPPPGNQGRSCFRPHVAKSYFETYKSCDHMQNFRPLSQKFSKISRFEKFEFLRFWLTEIAITRSSFEIESSSFGFSLNFMCFKIYVLQLLNDLNFYFKHTDVFN